MGKYGTNLEGFGAFEGGVNMDKGAPLISTSSDGETAFMFGPSANRAIKGGVENGDFAIPPDAAGDTITEENPLPYWTFTDTSSAGGITAAIVSDADAGSGNVLRFTIASGLVTGKSAKITRLIPIPSSASRSFSFYAEATFKNATNTNQSNVRINLQFYKSDQTTTVGSTAESGGYELGDFVSAKGITAPDFNFPAQSGQINATAPASAAYVQIEVRVSTSATQSAVRTIDLTEVRLTTGLPEAVFTDRGDPATYRPSAVYANSGVLTIDAPVRVQIKSANSNWLARVTATAAQSLANNTLTKITFNTASASPTTDSYDPQTWFDNANDRIVIGQDGFYNITANIGFAANATSRRLVQIFVNGSDRGSVQISASSAATTLISVSTNVYLAATDYVEVHALQQSGGALNTVSSTGVYPVLSVGRIGA